MNEKKPLASIIIPAKHATSTIGRTLKSILKLPIKKLAEIIVVIDGKDDSTAAVASQYPIKLIYSEGRGPGAARNTGIRNSTGKILYFLDADCIVSNEWFHSHLEVHKRYNGLLAVGGSIRQLPNSSFWAKCDYYSSWYNVNPDLPADLVPNHPSANLSMTRSTFDCVGPFREDLPRTGVHEEIEWESRLQLLGGIIRFEPRAAVWHCDRDDLISYLKHNYRWGYNSIMVKSVGTISRFPWVYSKPWGLVVLFIPFAFTFTLYTILCWLRIGKLEPLIFGPVLFFGRLAYASGMAIGWRHATDR